MQGLTLEQAAATLGLSVTTVRRRVKQKKLRATLVTGEHGPEYRVHLESDLADHPVGDREQVVDQPEQERLGTDQPAVTSLVALVDRLTTENGRLQDERAELYGRLGFLQAQLQAKDEQIKALAAPKEPEPNAANSDGSAAPSPPRWPEEPAPPESARPWWRFW